MPAAGGDGRPVTGGHAAVPRPAAECMGWQGRWLGALADVGCSRSGERDAGPIFGVRHSRRMILARPCSDGAINHVEDAATNSDSFLYARAHYRWWSHRAHGLDPPEE